MAAVVPTSGLLADMFGIYPRRYGIEWRAWGAESGDDDFEDLRFTEFFVDELDDCPLSVEERQQLLETILWPALSFSIQLARRGDLRTGAALRDAVYEASGMEQLKAVMEDHFFAHAG